MCYGAIREYDTIRYETTMETMITARGIVSHIYQYQATQNPNIYNIYLHDVVPSQFSFFFFFVLFSSSRHENHTHTLSDFFRPLLIWFLSHGREAIDKRSTSISISFCVVHHNCFSRPLTSPPSFTKPSVGPIAFRTIYSSRSSRRSRSTVQSVPSLQSIPHSSLNPLLCIGKPS